MRSSTCRSTTLAASAAPSSARASCSARVSTTRSGPCTATSASSASPVGTRGARATRAAGRPTPTSSTPTSRSWPTCPRPASCSASTASSSPTSAVHGGRHRLPASDDVLAKWMALTSDEDRVIRRANMHLVGRQHDPARVRRDLWRLAEWERRRRRELHHREPVSGDLRRRSRVILDGPDRAGRARLPEGDRLRRRRAAAADRRHRQHLDRDDAVQLPPAAARRAREGRRPRGRRHADGVQHGRDLGRDHDGHRGHARVAREPRGDRRLDRARRARPHVRRGRGALRLRQDDPRLRDGARAPATCRA